MAPPFEAVVFVGPSLRPDDLPRDPGWRVRPPAAAGDLLRRLEEDRPRAVALIDGVFETRGSVRHKEILWALARGVHVLGGGSLGALRAAETKEFGTVGVGRIFAAYRDGLLSADDEVALLHAPPEAGHAPLTLALVDVRATLERAVDAAVIAPEVARALLTAARTVFYKRRDWPAVLAAAAATVDPAVLDALRARLAGVAVDQKRLDALAVLQATRGLLASGAGPFRPGFAFARTEAFDDLRAAATADAGVLDELRLDETAYRAAAAKALLVHLAEGDAPPDEAATDRAIERLRERRDLLAGRDWRRWLADNRLDDAAVHGIAADEARVAGLADALGPALGRRLLDRLKLDGRYPALAERAGRKRRLLAERGLDAPRPADLGLTPAELVARHFARRPGGVPDDLDAHARSLGLEGAAELHRLLTAEWLLTTKDGGA